VLVKVCVEDVNGFITPLGKRKPPPKKLLLDPQDIFKYSISDVSFTPAYFNYVDNETHIMTSTGKYLIIWNFENIKHHKKCGYTIKLLEDQSVKNHWRFTSDDVIVTMANRVGLQKRKL
jgi:hypothetical protein